LWLINSLHHTTATTLLAIEDLEELPETIWAKITAKNCTQIAGRSKENEDPNFTQMSRHQPTVQKFDGCRKFDC